jgi:5-formyltetrahydrofolate cyclo-ligase
MYERKAALRHQLRTRRQVLSTEEVAILSNQIARRAIEGIEWASITSLHIYQPLRHQQEIDTDSLLQTIWQHYPRIQTATWQKTPDGYTAYWIDDAGLRAPVPPEQQFSAIVVPLLGFNDAGHRIGFGGGFYDRFLAAQPNAVTIGLCYAFGQTTFEPEVHDVSLTHIVTETHVKSFIRSR